MHKLGHVLDLVQQDDLVRFEQSWARLLPSLVRVPYVVHVTNSDPMTTKQVARVLGKSISTVGRLARSGELPPRHKLDGDTGAYLFDPEAVDSYKRSLMAENAA